jgi:hypothetical protein
MHHPQPQPPDDRTGLPTVALLLHTVVPPATDHPYRKLPSPAGTASHLAHDHRIDPDGEHAELLCEHFSDPDQLHRFAHEPAEERVLLDELVDPLVDKILHLLGQLPSDLHPIVLAEAALATRLGEAPSARPATHPRAIDDPPDRGGR